jgi:hypothetical protein
MILFATCSPWRALYFDQVGSALYLVLRHFNQFNGLMCYASNLRNCCIVPKMHPGMHRRFLTVSKHSSQVLHKPVTHNRTRWVASLTTSRAYQACIYRQKSCVGLVSVTLAYLCYSWTDPLQIWLHLFRIKWWKRRHNWRVDPISGCARIYAQMWVAIYISKGGTSVERIICMCLQG